MRGDTVAEILQISWIRLSKVMREERQRREREGTEPICPFWSFSGGSHQRAPRLREWKTKMAGFTLSTPRGSHQASYLRPPLLNISPNAFGELEGRIFPPDSSFKKPEGDWRWWYVGPSERRRIGRVEQTWGERRLTLERARRLNPWAASLWHSRSWSSDSAHAATSATGALQSRKKVMRYEGQEWRTYT